MGEEEAQQQFADLVVAQLVIVAVKLHSAHRMMQSAGICAIRELAQ